MYTMRKGERKVMEVFWDADQPMSHSDLCAKMNGTMSKNTLYLHLNRLLDHDLVEVESLVRRAAPMAAPSAPPSAGRSIMPCRWRKWPRRTTPPWRT